LGPRAGWDALGKREISFPSSRIDVWFVGCPACSVVIVVTVLSCLFVDVT
jgi:hypothetical protein